jgi:hypothetical protein
MPPTGYGRPPLRQLVRSKVRLAGGGVAPDGRISLGTAVRASVEPWLPGRGACVDWPVTFTDWGVLQGDLQIRFDEGLASASTGPTVVVLTPSLHATMTFDAIAQVCTWSLADAAGRLDRVIAAPQRGASDDRGATAADLGAGRCASRSCGGASHSLRVCFAAQASAFPQGCSRNAPKPC